MEDLVRLLPRKIVVAVLVPFFVGVALLALVVSPTPEGRAFVYLLFVGGTMVLVLLVLWLTLVLRQDQELDQQPAE